MSISQNDILEAVGNMSVMEVVELIKAFEEKFGVTAAAASAEEIGQVSTVFKFVGPNDRIVVEAFDDPKVDGVSRVGSWPCG